MKLRTKTKMAKKELSNKKFPKHVLGEFFSESWPTGLPVSKFSAAPLHPLLASSDLYIF